VSAIVLDAGALVAIEREDRGMAAKLEVARLHGLDVRTHAMVIAQVWRGHRGRRARLGRFLGAVQVASIGHDLGRAAGELCAAAGTRDPIDAALVCIGEDGDRILTDDVGDLTRRVEAPGRRLQVLSA
jgi:hypothetical protein